MEKERDAAESRKQELEEAESKRAAQIKDLQSQLASSIKRAESAVEQNAGLKEDNAGLLSTLQDVRAQVTKITEECTEIESELRAVREQLATAQADAEQLQKQQSDETAESNQVRSILQNCLESDDVALPLVELAQRIQAKIQSTTDGDAEASASRDLERSELASRIRSLEAELHDQTRRNHQLNKRLTTSNDSKSYTGLSRAPPAQSSRIDVDVGLTPAVRHKRQASLALLKARMIGSDSSSFRLDDLSEEATSSAPRFAQISDDAVFWCSCCSGDLITL